MERIILYSQILLNILSILGLFISIDFFFETKRKTFKIFSIAWTLSLISGMLSLFIEPIYNEFLMSTFRYIYAISYMTSVAFFTFAFLMYFLKIKMKYFIILFAIISVPSAILILLSDFEFVNSYMLIIGGVILSSGLLFPLLKYKQFKNKFRGSIKWYFLLAFLIIVHTILSIINRTSQELFGEIVSVINDYTFAIIVAIIIIILTIHLEYNIMHEEKNKLIDKYSHDLGNIMQAIYSSCQLMNKKETNDEKLDDLEKLQSEKLKEASKLIKEIRKL